MARRPVGRALEMGVAEAAVAPARDHRPLTHLGQISEQGFAVFLVDLCSGRHLQHDIVAALAPVAAVRSAELDKFLAPERHAAVPAVTRAHVDLGFIEEFHDARYATAGAKIREPARTPAHTAQ